MAGDAHRLLGSNTAASVLDWLTSRGRDRPVHIPMKTIKLSRECFSLIDLDRSGTLEPAELQAVFRLGKPEAKDKPVYGSVVLNDGSLVLVQLRGVNEGAAATDEEKLQIRGYLASRAGSQDFAAFRKLLKESADITRY